MVDGLFVGTYHAIMKDLSETGSVFPGHKMKTGQPPGFPIAQCKTAFGGNSAVVSRIEKAMLTCRRRMLFCGLTEDVCLKVARGLSGCQEPLYFGPPDLHRAAICSQGTGGNPLIDGVSGDVEQIRQIPRGEKWFVRQIYCHFSLSFASLLNFIGALTALLSQR
jgi:hypothetical protein